MQCAMEDMFLPFSGLTLQCDAEIIKEIVSAETVTTSMLVQAAHEVMKSLEVNWWELIKSRQVQYAFIIGTNMF